MSIKHLLIGLMLLAPVCANASLYDDIRATVEREQLDNAYDADVITYLATLFEQSEEGIQYALSGRFTEACDVLTDTGSINCEDLIIRIIQTGKQEANLRKFGRELQEIASGEEVAVSYIPGRSISLFFDLSALINLWTPGDKAPLSVGGDMALVTKGVDRDRYSQLFTKLDEVATRLKELKEEELIAAVWRYDAGVRLVREERNPDFPAPFIDSSSGPGTERQYLLKRWNANSSDIETKLMEMWPLLPTDNDGVKNLITYFVFAKMEEKLPSNVIVWARKGGQEKNGRTVDYGDIGLAWKTPLLPVMPSLLKRDSAGAVTGIITGGLYPPDVSTGTSDPKLLEGRKLCSDPVSNRGYLCSQQKGAACPIPTSIDPNAINLINCKTASSSVTTSGPDICRDLEWRTTPGHDPAKSSFNPNKQCVVSLNCNTFEFSGGITKRKKSDGTIEVGMNPSPKIPTTYYEIHELVHAGQMCNKGIGETGYILDGDKISLKPQDIEYNREACCTYEGEAYRTQCEAMEQDGVFRDSGGNRIKVYGVELNATVCAEAYTDYSCNNRLKGVRCPRSRELPFNTPDIPLESLFMELMENEIGKNNRANVPYSCEDAIDVKKMDPRVRAKLKEVNAQYPVTGQGDQTTYRNTVGNGMCYVGQAAEETIESHNMTPQRVPAGTVDEKNPFQNPTDRVPATEFPTVDVPLSNLPIYKPKWVVNQLDTALCSQQGLPLLSPSILCTARYLRRLQLPLNDYVSNADSLVEQQAQGAVSTSNFDGVANGVGGRIATGIYEHYAPRVIAPLMSLLKEAVRQLKLLPTIPFPEEMCPVGAGS